MGKVSERQQGGEREWAVGITGNGHLEGGAGKGVPKCDRRHRISTGMRRLGGLGARSFEEQRRWGKEKWKLRTGDVGRQENRGGRTQ